MKRLGGWFNPSAQSIIDNAEMHQVAAVVGAEGNAQLGRDMEEFSAAIDALPSDFAFYSSNAHVTTLDEFFDPMEAFETGFTNIDVGDAYTQQLIEPTTFQEAFNHPDHEQRMKWHAAIKKEFNDMNKRKVWCKVYHSFIPNG